MTLAENLRSSIYQSALQGGLTYSYIDENTSNFDSTFNAEEPYEIPATWKWCKFSDVVNIATNLVEPSHYREYLQIAPDYIEKGTGRLLPCNTVSQNNIKSKNHLFHEGQIIYSKIRPALRKAVIAPFDGLCSADMYPLDTVLNDEYLLLFLLSDFFTNLTALKSSREKMPKINQKDLNEIPIPVPPLDEQMRIVDSVNMLLLKVSEFSIIEQQLIELKENFPSDMRGAILQAAMQGSLTNREANDSSVEDLLADICTYKSTIIAEKKVINGKAIADDEMLELPFEIPSEWKLVNLGMVSFTKPSKQYQIQQKEILQTGMYPVVSQSIQLIEGYCNDISKLIRNNSVILVFGDHSKTLKYIDFDFIVGADGTKLIVPILINAQYLFYALQYSLLRLPNKGYARHFGLLSRSWIPLPPIEEQQRIVERLDALLPLCDTLVE